MLIHSLLTVSVDKSLTKSCTFNFDLLSVDYRKHITISRSWILARSNRLSFSSVCSLSQRPLEAVSCSSNSTFVSISVKLSSRSSWMTTQTHKHVHKQWVDYQCQLINLSGVIGSLFCVSMRHIHLKGQCELFSTIQGFSWGFRLQPTERPHLTLTYGVFQKN